MADTITKTINISTSRPLGERNAVATRCIYLWIGDTLFLLSVLGSLVGIYSRRIDRTLVNTDCDAFGDFYDKISIGNVFNLAIYAAGSHDIATGLEAFTEFLNLFLTFLLRTNHEEVENHEERDNHQDARPSAAGQPAAVKE